MEYTKLIALLKKQRGDLCEECGHRLGTQLNHWIIHRIQRYLNILTCPENCGLVCDECHTTGACHTTDSKKRFAKRQRSRGYDITAWIESLPFKVQREKF